MNSHTDPPVANLLRGMRDRDLATFIRREVVPLGWRITIGGDNHIRLYPPVGPAVGLSGSQFSGPATKQAIARIKRAMARQEKG